MTTFSTDARPRRRDDVLVAIRDDRTELTTAAGELHVLNPTAHALWQLCDGLTTPSEMAAAVCDVFDVHVEIALRDVAAGLGALVRDGLVEVPK